MCIAIANQQLEKTILQVLFMFPHYIKLIMCVGNINAYIQFYNIYICMRFNWNLHHTHTKVNYTKHHIYAMQHPSFISKTVTWKYTQKIIFFTNPYTIKTTNLSPSLRNNTTTSILYNIITLPQRTKKQKTIPGS